MALMMRNYVPKIFFFLALLIVPFASWAQPQDIEVYGTVQERVSRLRGVSVVVFADGQQYLTESAANGTYSFHLPYGKNYVIHFKKSGYVTKMIEVQAKGVSREIVDKGQRFEKWQVSLFKRLEGIDYSDLEEPIGKVYFDFKKRVFDSDSEYTLKKLKKIEELEKQQEKKEKEMAKEEEAKAKAKEEAEAKKKAEAEAKAKAKAEAKAQRKAEEEARQKAKEEEAKAKAEEEERKAAEAAALAEKKEEAKPEPKPKPKPKPKPEEKPKPKPKPKEVSETIDFGAPPTGPMFKVDEQTGFKEFDHTHEGYHLHISQEYAMGITEEVHDDGKKVITRRIVVREGHGHIYKMVVHRWGGKFFFKDERTISEVEFQRESTIRQQHRRH